MFDTLFEILLDTESHDRGDFDIFLGGVLDIESEDFDSFGNLWPESFKL